MPDLQELLHIQEGDETKIRGITAPIEGDDYKTSYYKILAAIEKNTIHYADTQGDLPTPPGDYEEGLVGIAETVAEGSSQQSLHYYDFAEDKWVDTFDTGIIGDLRADIDDLDKNIGDVDVGGGDTDLQTQIGNNDNEISILQNRVSTNDSEIGNVDEFTAGDVSSQVSTNEDDIRNNDNNISTLQNRVSTNESEIGNVDINADGNLQTQIDDIDDKVGNLDNNLQDQVDNLENDVGNVGNTDLQTQIGNNDNNISNLQNRVSTNDSEIGDVSSFSADDLSSQVTINESDIDSLESNLYSDHNIEGTSNTGLTGKGYKLDWDTDFAFFGLVNNGSDSKDVAFANEQPSDDFLFYSAGSQVAKITGAGDIYSNGTNLSTQVSTNEDDIRNNDNNISDLQNRVSTNESDIGNVDINADGNLQTQIDDIDDKVGNIDNNLQDQVDNLENDVGNVGNTDLQTQIGNNDNNISNLQNRVSANDSDIGNVGSTDLQTQVSNNGSDIASLSRRVNSNDSDIASLSNQVSNNGSDIASLSNQVDNNDSEIGDVSSFSADDLSSQVTINESDIDSLESNLYSDHNIEGTSNTGLTGKGYKLDWDTDFAFFGLVNNGSDSKDVAFANEQPSDDFLFYSAGSQVAKITGSGDIYSNGTNLSTQISELRDRIEDLEKTEFSITDYSFHSSVLEDEDNNYQVTIENTGLVTGTQTVELVTRSGTTIASDDIEIESGSSREVTLSGSLPYDDGTTDVRVVTTDDQTAYQSVTVTYLDFQIQSHSVDNVASENQAVDFSVTIKNTGNGSGTQTIRAKSTYINQGSKEVTINSGKEKTVSISIGGYEKDSSYSGINYWIDTGDDETTKEAIEWVESGYKISGVTAPDGSERLNEPTIDVTVKNDSGISGTSQVKIEEKGLVNNELVESKNVSVSDGSQKTVSFDLPTPDNENITYIASTGRDSSEFTVNWTESPAVKFYFGNWSAGRTDSDTLSGAYKVFFTYQETNGRSGKVTFKLTGSSIGHKTKTVDVSANTSNKQITFDPVRPLSGQDVSVEAGTYESPDVYVPGP